MAALTGLQCVPLLDTPATLGNAEGRRASDPSEERHDASSLTGIHHLCEPEGSWRPLSVPFFRRFRIA